MAARTRENRDEPVTYLIEHAGLSRRGFVEWAHRHSVGVLLHQSQSRFVRVTDKIIEDLGDLYEERGLDLAQATFDKYGTTDIQEAYRAFREAKQESAQLPVKFTTSSKGKRPIERLVDTVGGMSTLSKALAIPESSVRFFASGKVKTVPAEMEEAMRRAQWPLTDSFLAETEKINASARS